MNREAPKTEILIVDDSKVIRWAASKILRNDYTVHEATNGLEAWEILQRNENIVAVFTDLQMEGSDGYELLALIRGSDETRLLNLPVIVITGKDDDDDTKAEVLNLGATDFITKPFDTVTLKNRAAAYIGYNQKLAEVEEKLEHDKLTGLANKQFFFTHGEKDLSLAVRHETELAVVLLEIDHFMALINDHGKQKAARVLLKISRVITESLRKEDLCARIGTARFALILPLTNRIGSLRSIERICEKISALGLRVESGDLDIRLSAGLSGIEPEPEQECISFIQLVGQAEEALNKAIASGGGRIVNARDGIAHPLGSASTSESTPVEQMARTTDENRFGMEITQAIVQIEAGVGDAISQEQLTNLIRTILPLMSHANKKLDLGMASALEVAGERLNG
ncbi:MAG: diguanylate cyclase [Candidatus Polarisedimenticolaceae bacterium]|nr:diguanylate cyclase [Candidatus Polarisedimenticolaceae bacterium]